MAAAVLLLCGCQTVQVPTNEPLPQNAQGMPVYTPGYALLPMLQQPKGEVVFIMAFSGGGKRSAAFAHGVLRGLRQIPVVEDGRTRSLLDELDYVAARLGRQLSGDALRALPRQELRDLSRRVSEGGYQCVCLRDVFVPVELGVAGRPVLRHQRPYGRHL